MLVTTPATVRAACWHDLQWEWQRPMRHQNIKCSSMIKLNHYLIIFSFLYMCTIYPLHRASMHLVVVQTMMIVSMWTHGPPIVTPQTSSQMCWWCDWPIVCDDSGALRRYHAMIEFRSMPIQDGPHNIEIYIKGVLQPSYVCIWMSPYHITATHIRQVFWK